MMLAMKTLTPIIVYYIILEAARGKEVCYEEIGCFSDDPPWAKTFQRPKAKLPWSPKKINTQFFLLTQKNPEHHQAISARNFSSFQTSSFQTSQKTILITHGMSDRAENNWVSDMCHELLLMEDVNCIGVDWRHGSGNIRQYVQAANNGRVVGAEIAYFLKKLQAELKYPPSKVHIIGHSLGAHIAGEAGRRVPGIRRLTGLDPAQLYFENTVEEVRLDPSDAGFVDVIHTDTKMIIDMLKTLSCNHFRSCLYYIHSIRFPDGFVSYPCGRYIDFTSGSCFPCPLQRCPTMGHHSEEYFNITDQKMKLYLNTGADPQHFSSWRYKISLTLNGTAETLGKMYISLYGAGGNVTSYRLESGNLVPGDTYSKFINSAVKLHPLDHVTFHWAPVPLNIFKTQLGASRIDIQTGEDGTISSFCGTRTVLDNITQVLAPCSDLDARSWTPAT